MFRTYSIKFIFLFFVYYIFKSIILVVFTGLNLERNEQPSSIETLRSSLDSEQNYQKALESIDIFVLDRDGFELIPEQIEIHKSVGASQNLKDVIQALLEASKNGLQTAIPEGTRLYEAYIDEKICYLDFSRELYGKHIGGTRAEFLTISSILKTVQANFMDRIDQVHILIEGGQEVKSIAGHIDISRSFSIR